MLPLDILFAFHYENIRMNKLSSAPATDPAFRWTRTHTFFPHPADIYILPFLIRSSSSSNDQSKHSVTLPGEEGVHSVWAASVGASGLKVAPAHLIPLSASALRVTLPQPPPLTVRETLELDVSISNNVDACMDVSVWRKRRCRLWGCRFWSVRSAGFWKLNLIVWYFEFWYVYISDSFI